MTSSKSSLVAIVYDGVSDPRIFKQAFDIYAAANDWTAAKKLLMLPLLLREKARRLFDHLKKTADDNTTLLTADQLVTNLIHLCEPQHEVLLYQFYERHRLPDESISKFAGVIQELLLKALPDISPEYMSVLLRSQLCLNVPEHMRALIQFSSTFGDTSWDSLLSVLDKTCPSLMLNSDNGSNRWDTYARNVVKHENIIKQEPIEANWVENNRRPMFPNQINCSNEAESARFEGTCDFCHFYGHKIADCNKRRRLMSDQARSLPEQAPGGGGM